MIEVDPGIPLMSSSSDVAPTIRESGTTLHLAFRLPSEDSALLSFVDVCDWHYGYPNDEALDAHPLCGLGLTPYNFHRTPVAHHGERAWIATFHDGTLTVFARDLKVVEAAHAGSPGDTIRTLIGEGPVRSLDDW
jgi:hypothetical protein